MKRSVLAWVALLVTVSIVITLFSFTVSANVSALAVYTLHYQRSTDNGSTWGSTLDLVLGEQESFTLYANQKIKITGITVNKINYNADNLYFMIYSTAFTAKSSLNQTGSNYFFKTLDNAIWGQLNAGLNTSSFSLDYTLSGYSSGTVTYNFQIFDSFSYDALINEIIDYLDTISNNLSDFYGEWLNHFLPHFDGIWTYICNTTYGIYTISSFGNALNRATLTNPLSAFNTSLSNILRSVYVPDQNLYSYDSVTYDSDGIGTVSTTTNQNWYQSILGQLKGSSAIEQHHMEMENEALEEGAGQAYHDYLGEASTNYGFLSDFTGLGILRSLYDKSESNYSILSILGMWFSTQNRDAINGTSENRSDPGVEDFVSQNSELDWFGEH